jgi:hypothetical protein
MVAGDDDDLVDVGLELCPRHRGAEVGVAAAAAHQPPGLARIVGAQRAADLHRCVDALAGAGERAHAAGARRVGQEPAVLLAQPRHLAALAPAAPAVARDEDRGRLGAREEQALDRRVSRQAADVGRSHTVGALHTAAPAILRAHDALARSRQQHLARCRDAG